ncbi:carbon-nitrogen hydrolase family protein [Streptomyces sp. NPDC026589]|uniref:carbon-nitrogen hydrolase family protein n=1 Tax=Streptomyces sp. NPDC026589 TaxID=3155609 RepID=UPI0034000E1D
MLITLVQQPAAGADPEENLCRGLAAVAEAAAQGSDLVLFPELWQIGGSSCPAEPRPRARWLDHALEPDAPWLTTFAEAAAEREIAVAITYLARHPDGPRNAAAVFDRFGRRVLVYAKVHICAFGWETVFVPGERFPVAVLDTRTGPVTIGVMICFDREFPESARALALAGAELILTPNACLLCDDRVGQFRARAFENMAAVAMANYPVPAFNGRSCAFDGVAVGDDGRPRDHTAAMAGPLPRLTQARIDLSALRLHRERQIWGGRWRRPAVYGPLLGPDPDRARSPHRPEETT